MMVKAFRESLRKVRDSLRSKVSVNLKDSAMMLEGQVEILKVYRDGREESVFTGKNIIVLQGRANMAHLLAGDDVGNRKVTTMKVGDSGHEPSSPTTPKLVSVNDTDLFGAVVISKPTDFSFPNGAEANVVQFEVTIDGDEANGAGSQAISEVGLYDTTDRMMAHRAFGLITKTEDFGLVFRWKVIF